MTGRPDLGFYSLVPLLLKEARTVDLQMRLVSENLLTKISRKQYSVVHGKLFELWDRYENNDISTSGLLRACGLITGLGPVTNPRSQYE